VSPNTGINREGATLAPGASAGEVAKIYKEKEEMVDIETIAKDVVDCAIQYCHAFELKRRGWDAETEVKLPLIYEDQKIDVGYRIDTLINKLVIVENKAVESLLPVHEAQLLTYMKLTNCKIGFLLNWNVPLMKHGIKRFILNIPGETPYPKKPSHL
jgi:GxxExxY protein